VRQFPGLSGPDTLDFWCACLASPDARADTSFTVINFLVGTNFTSGEPAAPADVTAPGACAAAPFVPFKDTFLCDRPGMPGGSCGYEQRTSGNRRSRIIACPSDKPVGAWNYSDVQSGRIDPIVSQCTDEALDIAGAFGVESEASCLPKSVLFLPASDSKSPCQLQNCACPQPVSDQLPQSCCVIFGSVCYT
jgi:hypothetical protein